MHTETKTGLLSCKPGNEPIEGEIKTFVIEQRLSKKGKPWLKIKYEKPEYGGRSYKIIGAEQTDFVDAHGNLSFNVELEPAPNAPANVPQSSPASQNGGNGVGEARQHIMQSANLYVLCVNAVDKYCAAHFPEVAQTSEMFQAATGTLFIEASRAGMVQKMPTKPIESEQKAKLKPPPQDDDEEVPF